MGLYLNLGNEGFASARRSDYVDKTSTIVFMNEVLNTERRYVCVTRARRFGKSMAAKMLCAYYDQSCDSRSLFEGLQVTRNSSFERYLNKYPVIYLDMTGFTTRYHGDESLVAHVQRELSEELMDFYPQVEVKETDDLMNVLSRIVESTKQQFIFIIDEWDAVCREAEGNDHLMDSYVNMLRRLFKGANSGQIFAGVYMTGILPIKKYNTQSALNNFLQFSMVSPGPLSTSFGFTEQEVKELCHEKGSDFDELKQWYDGYTIGSEKGIFNPNSVMMAFLNGSCENYWSGTGAFDNVSRYIQMNYDGLKDDVIQMVAGGRCAVNTTRFENDLSTIRSKDDVLTALIHLGYLAYDGDKEECFIPNREVAQEMQNAVEDAQWDVVIKAIKQSELLLERTLSADADAVVKAVDAIHADNTSILQYNDENSLACVLSLAYYAAKNDYNWVRELPTGLGFADIVLLPNRNVDKPAIVLEMKCDNSAETAITQIHEKRYADTLLDYVGKIVLVGINYDKKTKRHTCRIETVVK